MASGYAGFLYFMVIWLGLGPAPCRKLMYGIENDLLVLLLARTVPHSNLSGEEWAGRNACIDVRG